jgi:hypothetical protein
MLFLLYVKMVYYEFSSGKHKKPNSFSTIVQFINSSELNWQKKTGIILGIVL